MEKIFEKVKTKYPDCKIIDSLEDSCILCLDGKKKAVLREVDDECFKVFEAFKSDYLSCVPIVYDCFTTEDERRFVLYEHIYGISLRKFVENEGGLLSFDVKEITLKICDGISELHSKGIYGIGLNPDNVILSKSGEIFFPSPERVRRGDEHSPFYENNDNYLTGDIFSLGRLMLFMLNGEEDFEITDNTAYKDIIQKCTNDRKERRFKSADRLKKALDKKDRSNALSFSLIFIILVVIVTMLCAKLSFLIYTQ